MPSRYDLIARLYDGISRERLYRHGRQLAIELLELRPGERVLIVGCGTGLDFPYLQAAVGPAGQIVGLDASAAMLGQARHRAVRSGWSNVQLVQADAARFDNAGARFDAVLFSYSLAVITDWNGAWLAATAALRSGGRVAVVDTDLPHDTGRVARLRARFAIRSGGVHPDRKVWRLAETHTTEVRHRELAHGHIQVSVGTWVT
jgi:demethylmenaquinone methyltransferase/2-methoxy-6-polyprenyl-1,4-benzoquinol methylase